MIIAKAKSRTKAIQKPLPTVLACASSSLRT